MAFNAGAAEGDTYWRYRVVGGNGGTQLWLCGRGYRATKAACRHRWPRSGTTDADRSL